MAYCPRCHKQMGQIDTVCPQCGYDFPPRSARQRRRSGLAYSKLATVALIVGQVVAGLGSAAAVVVSVGALVNDYVFYALVVGPMTALFLLALMVVFARSSNDR